MVMSVRFLVGLTVKQMTGSRGRVDPCLSHCIFCLRGGMQNLTLYISSERGYAESDASASMDCCREMDWCREMG